MKSSAPAIQITLPVQESARAWMRSCGYIAHVLARAFLHLSSL
jgi:hypothetical protein